MEGSLIEVVAKAAGIGGVAIGTLLLLFRDFIRKNIFPTLTKEQAYSLLKLFLFLTWSIAALGIAAWIYLQDNKTASNSTGPLPTLVFNYSTESGWDVENIGRAAAMDVLVAFKNHGDDEWKLPTRLDTLRVGQKIKLPWVGNNPDQLGASYQDDLGNKRYSLTDEDRSEVKTQPIFPDWDESQIKKKWQHSS